MPTGARALLVAALGQAFLPALGEVFKFKSRPLPAPKSLQGLAAFQIYSPEDSPEGRGSKPFVEYRALRAHSTDSAKNDVSLNTYTSLQVALISETDYKSIVEKTGPACDGNAKTSELVVEHDLGSLRSVYFTMTSWEHVVLNETGTYFLLVSNCGDASMGEINGEVVVRNPFGYLSGTDYYKMSAYASIFTVYFILAVVWAFMCLTWKEELIVMHGIIGFILFLCLVESGAWLGYLSIVNRDGEVGDYVQCFPLMLSVLKTNVSFTFVLVISQGWPMTKEVVDRNMMVKMGLFGVVWGFVSYCHEAVLTHRHIYHLSSKFMLSTTVPALVVNALIFVWIFRSLGSLSRTLKERNLDEQQQAISRLETGLVAVLVLGCFLAMVQVLDSTGSLQVNRKYQFWAESGFTHIVSTFMVALSMWVWMPGAGSSQLGYAQPVDQNEEDGLWEGCNGVAPHKVGAQNDDQDL